MNCPLQSGHEPPQPWAEPVFVTSAPITRTTNMPHAVTIESHLRTQYIRACRPRFNPHPILQPGATTCNLPLLHGCRRRRQPTYLFEYTVLPQTPRCTIRHPTRGRPQAA